jgi:hypothetical protein
MTKRLTSERKKIEMARPEARNRDKEEDLS